MNSPWEWCTQFSIWFNMTYKNQGKGDARCTLLYKTFVFEATFRWEHILAYERAINLEWRSQLWSGPRSNSSRELVSSFNAVFPDLHNHATVVSVSRRKSLYRAMLRRMGGRDAEVVPKWSPILFFSFSVCVCECQSVYIRRWLFSQRCPKIGPFFPFSKLRITSHRHCLRWPPDWARTSYQLPLFYFFLEFGPKVLSSSTW